MLFKLSILALLASTIAAQSCGPACCDVLVMGDDSSTVGLKCTPGGIDCAFSGQVEACCEAINRFTHVGHNCARHAN